MKSVLQQIYDSEINASVSWFWDGGFAVKLGDSINGFVAETTCKRGTRPNAGSSTLSYSTSLIATWQER
jgi:hypothetical protein